MKAKPILLNDEMVRAIAIGRKTQTRRPFKVQQSGDCPNEMWPTAIDHILQWREQSGSWFGLNGSKTLGWTPAHWGQPGDLLWVRECWAVSGMYRDGYRYEYRAHPADGEHFRSVQGWKPSIHMPRCASRLTLLINDIRIARLNDISEVDAKAEGVRRSECEGCGKTTPCIGCRHPFYASSFRRTWDSIYSETYARWDRNPWVWVIGFDAVEANVDKVIEQCKINS